MRQLSAKPGVIRLRYPVELRREHRRELFDVWAEVNDNAAVRQQRALVETKVLSRRLAGPWALFIYDWDMIECDGERIERCHLADAIAIGAAVIHGDSVEAKLLPSMNIDDYLVGDLVPTAIEFENPDGSSPTGKPARAPRPKRGATQKRRSSTASSPAGPDHEGAGGFRPAILEPPSAKDD